MRIDRDALFCDFAEYYHLYSLDMPISIMAVLAWGLPDRSRIKMKVAGIEHPPEMLILGGIFDRLNLLVWFNTKDGQKGVNRPKPLFGETKNTGSKVMGFDTVEDFLNYRKQILER